MCRPLLIALTVATAWSVDAHAAHDVEVPLAVELLGHPAADTERRLSGTERLFLTGDAPANCRRFMVVVNPRGGPRHARLLPESERRCPP